MKKLSNYYFILTLSGVSEATPDLEDELYEAGCSDALINTKNGTVYLDFDRESESFEKAIISAIADVENAGINAKVTSVGPDNLVSISEIAKRANFTKQSISLFIQGKRGDNSFPSPIYRVGEKSPLWQWHNVAKWLYEHNKINDKSLVDDANTIANINSVIELRDDALLKQRQQLLQKILTTCKHSNYQY